MQQIHHHQIPEVYCVFAHQKDGISEKSGTGTSARGVVDLYDDISVGVYRSQVVLIGELLADPIDITCPRKVEEMIV